MEHRTYYYARVSSKGQNLDRQLAAFTALGASERDIITDKESGKESIGSGVPVMKINLHFGLFRQAHRRKAST